MPEERPVSIAAGSTRANLGVAISAESTERDRTYRNAFEVSSEDRDREVAKAFDETRDVETEHANLCAVALRSLESMKTPHAYYVCGKCGYTTDVRLGFCPLCRNAA